MIVHWNGAVVLLVFLLAPRVLCACVFGLIWLCDVTEAKSLIPPARLVRS